MRKCILLVFSDSQFDGDIFTVLENDDIRGTAILCNSDTEEVMCNISLKDVLPECLECVEI